MLKVHWDAGDPPYYSIQLDSTGAERQTDAQRLEKFVPDYNAGAAAPPPTLDWPQVQQPAMGFGQQLQQQAGLCPAATGLSTAAVSATGLCSAAAGVILSSRSPQAAPRSAASQQQGFPHSSNRASNRSNLAFNSSSRASRNNSRGFNNSSRASRAAQMNMQQQPQGGFPGGFPGQGGF